MDVFIDRVIDQFRQRVWELLVRGPRTAEEACEEARRVHKQLRKREWHDLVRDPEAHMFLGTADLLSAFSGRKPPDAVPSKYEPAWRPVQREYSEQENPVTQQEIVAQLRERISDLSALCLTILVLSRRDRMPLDRIALRLSLPVTDVRGHLRTAIQHCAADRLCSLERAPRVAER